MSSHRTFMELYRARVFVNPTAAFDAAVEEWHAADTDLNVYQWLGMDERTYRTFVEHSVEPRREHVL